MKYLTLLLLILMNTAASAQQLKATADSQQLIIGNRMQLKIEASFPHGVAPQWFQVDTFPHFEILNTSAVDSQKEGDNLILSQSVTLTSWDSGKWQIPAFTLGKMTTKPITVNVVFNPSPFDRGQPYHDIKDIIEVKKPVDRKWYWYFLFAIILLALFMLFFPAAKKKDPATGFVPDANAYQKALRELDALSSDTTSEPTKTFTSLVHIFREYLQKRKNILSHSRTTDDLAVQLADQGLPRDDYQKLVQSLRLADLVKFAKMEPRPQDTKEAITIVKESIILLEHRKDAV